VTIAPTVCGKNLEALDANLQHTLGQTFGNELNPWVAALAHDGQPGTWLRGHG
jgi:hypothetical protein